MQENHSFFEAVYAQSNRDKKKIPWAKDGANAQLKAYLETNPETGKALVIGCGLGDDAKLLEQAGFEVTAFDLSASAVAWCEERFVNSKINFLVADILNLPSGMLAHFDFVFECQTIQSIPEPLRSQTIEAIASTVKPKGEILVIANGKQVNEQIIGPPWPLDLKELNLFKTYGLQELNFTTSETTLKNNPSILFSVRYQK